MKPSGCSGYVLWHWRIQMRRLPPRIHWYDTSSISTKLMLTWTQFLPADNPTDVGGDLLKEPKPPTKIDLDSDSDIPVSAGQKRAACSGPSNSRWVNHILTLWTFGSPDFERALKHTKAFSNLDDTCPTLHNKPSGLKTGWYCTVSGSSMSHQKAPSSHVWSSSSSTSVSTMGSHSPILDFNHTSNLAAMTPPPPHHKSSPFHGDSVPLIDAEAAECNEYVPKEVSDPQLLCLTSTVGWNPSSPGIYLVQARTPQEKSTSLESTLPSWLCDTFCKHFICSMVEQVCLTNTLWTNPTLSTLQREFNHIYPAHWICLYSDDAAVVPVSNFHLLNIASDDSHRRPKVSWVF